MGIMSSLGAFPLAIEFTTMKSSPCVISLDEDSFIAPGGGGGHSCILENYVRTNIWSTLKLRATNCKIYTCNNVLEVIY